LIRGPPRAVIPQVPDIDPCGSLSAEATIADSVPIDIHTLTNATI
jgi:hypothetical protein